MKVLSIIFVSSLMMASSLPAALPVIDSGAISTQLATAKQALVQQLQMELHQRTQIGKTVEQIQQIDTYLEIFGDPGAVDLATLRNLSRFIRGLPSIQSTYELERLLPEEALFIEQSLYPTISRQVVVDGEAVHARQTNALLPALTARQDFRHYHALKDQLLQERGQIDGQIESAIHELQSATTVAEVAKLQVAISTLNARRAALSEEIHLAASGASTRFLQNELEAQIAREARYETQRVAAHIGMRKNLVTFRFPQVPTLFDE